MSDQSNRRGKVTDEHREEARRLKALWEASKARRQANGVGSQEAFGATYEIGNQSAVGFFLNGRTALSPKAARGFVKGIGCKISDFSPRIAEMLSSPLADPDAAGWPFPGIEPERFYRLSEQAKLELQGVVRERLDAYERSSAEAPAPMTAQREALRKPRAVPA
jgi:hypothetical protein